MRTIYWLIRRARLRYLWRRGRINVGQFMVGMVGAPKWVAVDSETYARKLRRYVRHLDIPRRRVIWSCEAAKGPLLTRYYLIVTPIVALYLHRLHASDEDRALHDHPWSFLTFLLSSGYWEHHEEKCLTHDTYHGEWMPDVRTVRTWRRRFSILWRPAEWRHRLELVRPTWTLVLRFRTRREWGFVTPAGWMHWKAYGREWCD